MSEPAQPVAGNQLTPEQEAFLLASQAKQAATSPSPAEDAAPVQAQMETGQRGPLLPAEEQMDAMMAQLKAQSDQLAAVQAQMLAMGRQIEEAQAAQGGPLTVRYAQGAADKITALAAAHSNNPLGAAHWHHVAKSAEQLVEAATGVSKGAGPLQLVRDAATDIERFAARGHARQGGRHVDWSAILDDVELAVTEAVKLVA